DALWEYLPHMTAAAALEILITVVVIPWVLLTKRDTTAALAWCLVVLLMPLAGAVLFWVFGYNHVARPLRSKRSHRSRFAAAHPPEVRQARRGRDEHEEELPPLAKLALAVEAFPLTRGNRVTLYHDTNEAFTAMLDAIAAAKEHIHLEFYIFRGDTTGRKL